MLGAATLFKNVSQPPSMRFTRREQLTDIVVNTDVNFHLFKFPLTPSSPTTFPWLSSLSSSFDLFRIDRLQVIYAPTVAVSASGKVIMAFDYDVADSNTGITTQELSVFAGAVQFVVYQQGMLAFRPESTVLPNHRYFLGEPYDDRLNVPANLYIAFQGCSAGTPGTLWVDYDIQMYNPQYANLTLGATSTQRKTTTAPMNESPFGSQATSVLTGIKAGADQDTLMPALNKLVNGKLTKSLYEQIMSTAASAFLVDNPLATFHNPVSHAAVGAPTDPETIIYQIRGRPNTHVRFQAQWPIYLTIPEEESEDQHYDISNIFLTMFTDPQTVVDNQDGVAYTNSNFWDVPVYYSNWNGRVPPPYLAGTSAFANPTYAQVYRLGPTGIGLFWFRTHFRNYNGTEDATMYTYVTTSTSNWCTFTVLGDVQGVND